jgi:hypothetical protein
MRIPQRAVSLKTQDALSLALNKHGVFLPCYIAIGCYEIVKKKEIAFRPPHYTEKGYT